MKTIKTTLAALLAATLLGCAAAPQTTAVKDVTISQPACCSNYSEFAWIPLNGNEIDFAIDEYSQVGDFPDGKSYFAGFVLPENVERMQVEIASWMRSVGVFAPKVLLLDPQFQVVDTLTLDDFEVKLSDMFHLASYQTRLVMEQETTPYMVIYSPKDYRVGEIQIPHPERVRAEELGLARPMVTDPTIQHAKFGTFELDLKPLTLRSYRANAVPQPVVMADQAAETSVSGAKAVNAVPNPEQALKPQAKPVTASAIAKPSTGTVAITGATMLPESEAFYNQQIKTAVDNNDMKKALTLMEEAKRAGSTSAEATFLQLIKR